MSKSKKNIILTLILVLVAVIAVSAIMIWFAKSHNDDRNGNAGNNSPTETTQIEETIQVDEEGENRDGSNDEGLSQLNGSTSFVKEDGSIMDFDEKVEQFVKSGLDEETARKILSILENPSDID